MRLGCIVIISLSESLLAQAREI